MTDLIAEGATLQLRGIIDIEVKISGKYQTGSYLVTSHGNQAHPEHIQVILEAKPPRKGKEFLSFHGTWRWLREYIPHFAVTAALLTDLLAVSRTFKWTAATQESFKKIEALIKKPLALSRPNPQLPFILQTDASAKGIGAVPFEEDKEKNKFIISYMRAKFNQTQSRYHCNEQECLTVIQGIKRYRPYLEDNHFTLRTDSTALTWLRKMKDKKSKLNSRSRQNPVWGKIMNQGTPYLSMMPIRGREAATGEVRPAFNEWNNFLW